MLKARSLKEGVTEKSQSGGFSLGNVQVRLSVLNPIQWLVSKSPSMLSVVNSAALTRCTRQQHPL